MDGFNDKTAREEAKLYSPSLFMLGNLLDSPPSHPDTIMTCIDYMKQNMEDMGMEYIHIYIYHVICSSTSLLYTYAGIT